MSHPSIVRHLKNELLGLRSNGLTLREIADKYGVNEASIRKTIGRTGCVKIRRSCPINDRFWEKVEIRKTDDCWEWTGALGGSGYGHILMDKKTIDAHRVSYVLANGEIPNGLEVLHCCNNKKCVNPNHLKLGTQRDNMIDFHIMRREGKPSITLRRI